MNRNQTVILGVIIWFGLAFLGIFLQNYYDFWQYIFFLRIPIIVGLLLMILPFIAVNTSLSAMLKNLFVLRNKTQLILVITGAVLAGLATIRIADVIFYNSHLRFGVTEKQAIPEFWQILFAIILSLPISIEAIKQSKQEIEETSLSPEIWGIIVGIVLSGLLLIISSLSKKIFENNQSLEQILLTLINFLPERIQQGYVDGNHHLSYGISQLVVFSISVLIIYILGYVLFKPRPVSRRFEVPALFYLTLILSVAVLWLGQTSFFNDISRIPTLLLFLVISSVSYLIFGVDHFYKIYKLSDEYPEPRKKEWIDAIFQRLENQRSEAKTLVVVCASGGGIQASGWTTKVLTGLQEALGTKFTKAIGWISAVSGGSVGTMFYLDRFGEQGFPEPEQLDKIFKSATEDSLDATGWGLAYPDLLRLIGLPFLVQKEQDNGNATDQDRGTAIEIDWQGEMKTPDASFGSWRKKIHQGILPIPIFNATLVEDGRRFLVSPMTFCNDNDKHFADFNTLYPGFDIDVTTSARLSATFPYVSPVCRPNQPTQWNYHVGDGGYFDNFGVVTSVELLDQLLEQDELQQIRQVIFLQINAFPDDEDENRQDGGPGWVMEVIGSLLALLNVRSSAQNGNNKLNVALLKDKYECGYAHIDNEKKLEFLKGKYCQKGVKIHYIPIKFPKGKIQPPLSWQLTQEQKKAIISAWNEWKTDNREYLQEMERALQ
ncbi:patatin-like phospholipase family protein [Anabaena azotica]|uniref:Patatin-like phospholipase family protein n=1 Tax=Anabaena azotica FACHB-119 TaxID=947527 RepID=A0ABR8D8X3_9NOST|nr:patatin-like phospholipase family protein [Anabaena azotica]MBD2503544.1 patatin-like phospholipase family protein [Anabaena azotica FACHB-119]